MVCTSLNWTPRYCSSARQAPHKSLTRKSLCLRMYVSISHPHTHHAVAQGLITYSTHYSDAFYCHNRLFYLTLVLLSLVDSLFSLTLLSLSLSQTYTYRAKMKLLIFIQSILFLNSCLDVAQKVLHACCFLISSV